MQICRHFAKIGERDTVLAIGEERTCPAQRTRETWMAHAHERAWRTKFPDLSFDFRCSPRKYGDVRGGSAALYGRARRLAKRSDFCFDFNGS